MQHEATGRRGRGQAASGRRPASGREPASGLDPGSGRDPLGAAGLKSTVGACSGQALQVAASASEGFLTMMSLTLGILFSLLFHFYCRTV